MHKIFLHVWNNGIRDTVVPLLVYSGAFCDISLLQLAAFTSDSPLRIIRSVADWTVLVSARVPARIVIITPPIWKG